VEGQVEVKEEPQAVAPLPVRSSAPPASRAAPRRGGGGGAQPGLRQGTTRVYAHAASRDLLERVLRDLGPDARVVGRLENADVILTLRSRANDPKLRKVSEKTGARVLAIKRNSSSEMRRVLRDVFLIAEGVDEEQVREAVAEAEHAIQRVLSESVVVPLAPRPPRLRKLQHRLVSRYHLETVSHGSEPQRHLIIYPLGALVDFPQGRDGDGDREEEEGEGAGGLV
jgi:hypothetical protein